MITIFPETITFHADGNKLKLVSIRKDGESAMYQYVVSKTKKGQITTLTLKQINELYKPTEP